MIEVLRQALDVLLDVRDFRPHYRCSVAITNLRNLIDQMEKVEPVAWCETDDDGEIAWDKDSCFSDDPAWFDRPIPLYAAPITPELNTGVNFCDWWDSTGTTATPDTYKGWEESCRQAFEAGRHPAPVAPVKQEPVAWMFDLATLCSQEGEYSNWENRIQRFMPTVPANAIRNIIPLYTAPVVPEYGK